MILFPHWILDEIHVYDMKTYLSINGSGFHQQMDVCQGQGLRLNIKMQQLNENDTLGQINFGSIM